MVVPVILEFFPIHLYPVRNRLNPKGCIAGYEVLISTVSWRLLPIAQFLQADFLLLRFMERLLKSAIVILNCC